LIDYGFFQTGSYWVYIDSTSLALDSVYVTSAKQGIVTTVATSSRPYHGYFGDYNVYLQSTYEGVQYQYSVNTENTFDYHSEIVEDKWSSPDSLKETWLMIDYFVSGQTFLESPTYTYAAVVYENQYDSLKILNDYFKNVMLFHDGKNQTQNNSPTNYYLAKNVGIIRKEILASHRVWSLVRYHIVQ